MIYGLYAVKDLKCEFDTPFARQNDELAKRDFVSFFRSEKPNFLNQNPEDFELWKVGTYDTARGLLCSEQKFICSIGGENDNRDKAQ